MSLPSLFYLTVASFVLYGSWLGDKPEQMFWLNTALYLPFALLVAIELAARSLRLKLAAPNSGENFALGFDD